MVFAGALMRFYAPPASTGRARSAAASAAAAVAAEAAAPHREGRPQRHAPLWLVKATSHRGGVGGTLGRKGVKTMGCDASAKEVKLDIKKNAENELNKL